jgi:predicted PurR-regulated permease PerM
MAMNKENFINWSIESTIRLALIFIMVYVGFLIIRPFLLLFIWAIIIGVALFPLFTWLVKKLKGRKKLSALLIVVVALSILVVPTALFIDILIESTKVLAEQLESGTFRIPLPDEEIKEWPVIGSGTYDLWQQFATNTTAAFEKYEEQLADVGKWLLSGAGGLISSVLVFMGSVLVAAVFMVKSDYAYHFTLRLATTLVGKTGKQMVLNARDTIQNVVKGVLGVALIQAILIGIGFFAAGVPGAPILTLAVFVLAIVQLPPSLLVIPIVIYVFSVETTTVAIIFTIWEILAGISDNVLKPLLLGRGLKIPMLVILIGSIGGMLLMGIIGLFVGPVIIAVFYQLFNDWLIKEPIEA